MYKNNLIIIVGIVALTILSVSVGLSAGNPEEADVDTPIPETLGEKPEVELEELARLIHRYINDTREEKGLSPLVYDSSLAELAVIHSRDMAELNYFDHVNKAGMSPTDRARVYGYETFKKRGSEVTDGINENIIRIPLYKWVVFADGMTYHWRTEEEIARTVLSGWLGSPGHRKNLLNPKADREGIGIVITEDYRVYVTQDLW